MPSVFILEFLLFTFNKIEFLQAQFDKYNSIYSFRNQAIGIEVALFSLHTYKKRP